MKSTSPSVALITPSFARDFNRCELLCNTIQQLVPSGIKHYIVVDRIDYPLFSKLENPSTQIFVVEDLLPWWIQKTPFRSRFWINFKGIPIRNWVLQQIVKIAVVQSIDEDVAIFIDSDVALVRPFELEQFFQHSNVRMYCELNGNFDWMTGHVKWHHTASRLLGLEPTPMPAPDYIGNLITWRKSNVHRMCEHLEKVNGRSWIQCIASSWYFSEYILYGTFVNRLIPESSGHFLDARKLTLNYWDETPLSPEQLTLFFQKLQPEHLGVMISAKAQMHPSIYEPYVKKSIKNPEVMSLESQSNNAEAVKT